MKEKTAKEMFEELGYKEKSNNKKYLTYTKETIYIPDYGIYRNEEFTLNEIITFDKSQKRIGGSYSNKVAKKFWCDFKIIPAINKQIEELRWDE